MPPLLTPELYASLFVQRSKSAPLTVGPPDPADYTGSRLGGTAPSCVDPLLCQRCRGPMVYLLTLASDVLGIQRPTQGSLSVFLCADFSCLLAGQKPHAAGGPIAVLGHPDGSRAPRGRADESSLEGRSLSLSPVVVDQNEYGEVPQGSKLGGNPGLIQDDGGKLKDELERQGFGFLFQFDEETYPRDMKVPTFQLGCGALYVFCRRTGMCVVELDPTNTVALWQNT